MKEIKWEVTGGAGIGFNPLLNISIATLGKDKNGKGWLVKVSPQFKNNRFINIWSLLFDTSEETEDDSPFLRKAVTEARNYQKARNEYYHEVNVMYEDIQEAVWSFMEDNGIE